MALAGVHPSAADLEAFTLGSMGESSLAAVEAHVADCPTCQEQAAAASGDTLIELLRRAHGRAVHQTDTLAEAAAQAQTEAPLPAAAEAVTLAPDGADGTEVLCAVPEELARHERYRVVRLLGAGGMGSVFEAEHRVMRRPVAVKVINRAYTADAPAVERFRREVHAAARLSHPNIVTAHDAENVGDLHFLVMEYVEGQSLARVLKERGPLSVREACEYIRQAALGLQHAHERGMVHRDVKPDNLMLTASPVASAPGVIKVLDFGLAALTAERGAGGLTEANVIMGTPDYMAPEQAEDPRKADIRADVYGLGCTLYQLLTGGLPYPADTSLLKVLAHRERPVPSARAARPEVPRELDAVLARLLAKRPEDRFQTPGEAAAALAPFAQPAAVPPKKRPYRLVAVLAALLLAGITVAGAVVYRIQTDKGELVITTESDDVEVIVKKGGKQIRIIDTKTDKSITLDSGTYDLELKGSPDGLKLNISQATLTRGETVLAKIERIKPPVVVKEKPTALGKIELIRRIPISAAGDLVYHTDISKDGKYALVTRGNGNGVDLDVYDIATGDRLFDCPGYHAHFLRDGEEVVVYYQGFFSVHQTRTGKVLRKTKVRTDHETVLDVAPDGKHLLCRKGDYGCALFDLTEMKEQYSWPKLANAYCTWSADSKRLCMRRDSDKSWLVWDVDTNRASSDYNWLKEWQEVVFHDGNRVRARRGEERVLAEAASGKVIETLSVPDCTGRITGDFGWRGRLFHLGWYDDGTIKLQPFAASPESFRYELPETDRSRPPGSPYLTHLALSSDKEYAAVVTRKSLFILRLPPMPDAWYVKKP
jgi:serine/threonine protein kinase